jgi:DNA uptake protein ComE-like DNA-binding protein
LLFSILFVSSSVAVAAHAIAHQTATLAMVEIPAAGGEPPDADRLRPLARHRRVNINTDDESEIGKLPGVSFIEARRICMERPFQGMKELLKVRGISRDLIQQWEAGQPLPHTLPHSPVSAPWTVSTGSPRYH